MILSPLPRWLCDGLLEFVFEMRLSFALAEEYYFPCNQKSFMEKAKCPHPIHLFFCTNTREDKSSPSCGNTPVSEEMAIRLKKRFEELKLPVRVTRSGCLGPCAQGPNAMCYPSGLWFKSVEAQDESKIEAEIIALAKSLQG